MKEMGQDGRDANASEEPKKEAVPLKKKRKREPEVTIAPTTPGGPDISVE